MLATPAVRRLCRERSIDLYVEPISGTGPGGRVLKGDVLAYAARGTASGQDNDAESSTRAVAEVRAAKQPQLAGGHRDLTPLNRLGGTPAVVFHGGADSLGSLSNPASESASRPVGDWSLENAGVERSAVTATDSAGEAAAAGVRVVEEEQWTPPEKEPRRASGTREMKDSVSVPIKGGGDVACICFLLSYLEREGSRGLQGAPYIRSLASVVAAPSRSSGARWNHLWTLGNLGQEPVWSL